MANLNGTLLSGLRDRHMRVEGRSLDCRPNRDSEFDCFIGDQFCCTSVCSISHVESFEPESDEKNLIAQSIHRPSHSHTVDLQPPIVVPHLPVPPLYQGGRASNMAGANPRTLQCWGRTIEPPPPRQLEELAEPSCTNSAPTPAPDCAQQAVRTRPPDYTPMPRCCASC